jgi:hypothetical protein
MRSRREGALRGAADEARPRRADDLHAGHRAGLERPLPARAREDRHLVLRRGAADSNLSVAADAGVPAALRAADVPPLRQQRRAVAGVVLLAGRVHAPVRAVRRRRRDQPGRDAASRARHPQRGEDDHHADSHRPRVPGRRRAAPGAGGAAVVRRDGRLLGRGGAHHLDVEPAGLDLAWRRRVQQPAADDRDLHAAPDAERRAHRHEARDRALRRGGTSSNRSASCRTGSGCSRRTASRCRGRRGPPATPQPTAPGRPRS